MTTNEQETEQEPEAELDDDLRLALANRIAALAALNEQVRQMAAEHEGLVVFREEALQSRGLLEGFREAVEHHRRVAEFELSAERHERATAKWEFETEAAKLREELYRTTQRAIIAEEQPLRLWWNQKLASLKARLLRR